ncbi:MAG: hypothetical protein ACREQX_11010 [Candidatus Binataceae bacterium]
MGSNFYLVLALGASALLALGLLMMKSRADELPAATGSAVVRNVLLWLHDPVWLGGLLIQAGGYALYVISLAGAPVSLVSVVMQGGIGLFVLLAFVVLRERARPREWAGIAATLIGMVLLALSLSGGEAQGPAQSQPMIVISGLLPPLALLPYASTRLRHNGIAAAVFSGMMFGLASLYTKAMAQDSAAWGLTLRLAADPYVPGVIVTNIIGLIALQNSFVAARGIIAMPLSTGLSNIVPIAGGIVIFEEWLPGDPHLAALRIVAFVVTIAGGALLASRDDEVRPKQDEAIELALPHA